MILQFFGTLLTLKKQTVCYNDKKSVELIFMKKAIQIPYNDLFEKKCEYAKEAGFNHISVNFYEMLGKTEADWKKAIEHIHGIL